jgi:hypothetical protein
MQDSSKSMIGIFLIALAATSLSCKSDGDPGPAGPAGDKGAKGGKGDTGNAGESFYEAIRYGRITVYLDGTRPDDVAFKDTLIFKFTPTTQYSEAQIEGVDENYNVGFTVARFSAMDNYSAGDAYAFLNFRTTLVEGDTNRIFSIYIASDHYTTDSRYFRLENEFDNGYNEEVNISNIVHSRYRYTPANGSFKSKFSFTSLADDNSSGNDLNVIVVVDATVYQPLGGD